MKFLIFLLLLSSSFAQSYEDYKRYLTIEEGYRTHVYVDKMGNRTIGIGHKLLKNEDFTDLNDAQIEAFFKQDLAIAVEHFNKVFPPIPLDSYPDKIKVAVVSMIFNLGPSGFDKFVNFISAIKYRDYNLAIIEITNSPWYKQVPNRVKRVIEVLNEAK